MSCLIQYAICSQNTLILQNLFLSNTDQSAEIAQLKFIQQQFGQRGMQINRANDVYSGIKILSSSEQLTQFEISTIVTDMEYNNLLPFERVPLDDKRTT